MRIEWHVRLERTTVIYRVQLAHVIKAHVYESYAHALLYMHASVNVLLVYTDILINFRVGLITERY